MFFIRQGKAPTIVKQIIQTLLPLVVVGVGHRQAWSHPGHGQPGPAHYISAPEHGVFVVSALLTLGLLWFVTRNATVRLGSAWTRKRG